MPSYLYLVFEISSFFVALLNYKYLKNSFMKWFIPFLGFISFTELISYFIYEYEINVITNYLIAIVESVFYGYVFYNLSERVLLKKIVLVFIPLSIVSYFFSYFFLGKTFNIFLLNLIISGFIIAVTALSCLYYRFVDDEGMLLIIDPVFWISFGVSLFYAGVCIVFSLYDLIYKYNLSLFGLKLYQFVPRILSMILYLSISISIILWRMKSKKSLLP